MESPLLTSTSDLITAAEAINWPAVVNYASQPVEKRKVFEGSFFKLLKLQSMYVSLLSMESSVIEIWSEWERTESRQIVWRARRFISPASPSGAYITTLQISF